MSRDKFGNEVYNNTLEMSLEEPNQQVNVIQICLVNGESRSLRIDERTDVTVSH